MPALRRSRWAVPASASAISSAIIFRGLAKSDGRRGQRGTLFLGFAFAEATGLIGFAVAMLILFG